MNTYKKELEIAKSLAKQAEEIMLEYFDGDQLRGAIISNGIVHDGLVKSINLD